MITLNLNVVDGSSYNDTYTSNGIVAASNMSCYFQNNICRLKVTRHALAHAYGEMTSAFQPGQVNDTSQVLDFKSQKRYFSIGAPKENQTYAYRFNEYNINDTQEAYPHFTNRTITSFSGDCYTYNQTESKPGVDLYGDKSSTNYTYTNGSFTDSIVIPNSALGEHGTTYIYRGLLVPALAKANSCGPRCVWVWAYKNWPRDSDGYAFYQCPITVGNVLNASRAEHEIGDDIARVSATSIALQGRYAGDPNDDTRGVFTQYQYFARK